MSAYRAAMMLGRLTDGAERDHGTLTHAVAYREVRRAPCRFNEWKADCVKAYAGLCGAVPGRRSVGWSDNDGDRAIDCPRCLRAIARAKRSAASGEGEG